MSGKRLQVVLDECDARALGEVVDRCKLSESEVVRAAIRLVGERVVEPGDEELLWAETASTQRHPEWWPLLANELERRHRSGSAVLTESGIRNYVVHVDEAAGRLELKSERSRSGMTRTITLAMLEQAETTTMHGAMLKCLRALGAELLAAAPTAATGWVGPFRVASLLDNCIDRTGSQPWPPEDLGVYLVSRQAWRGAPTPACGPLYLGSTTGRTPRFATRVGDLVADMFGFFGKRTGHSSGGQRLWHWCNEHRVKPGHLLLGWYARPGMCVRCESLRGYTALRPELNAISPERCPRHPPP